MLRRRERNRRATGAVVRVVLVPLSPAGPAKITLLGQPHSGGSAWHARNFASHHGEKSSSVSFVVDWLFFSREREEKVVKEHVIRQKVAKRKNKERQKMTKENPLFSSPLRSLF